MIVIFMAVVFLISLMAVLLEANDIGKPEKTFIKTNKPQTQDTVKADLYPKQNTWGSIIPYNGEPGSDRVEDSYRFLELNKDKFQLENPRQELKLRGVIGPAKYADIKTTAVKFDQVVNGIKVASEGFTIQFESGGAYYFCHGQIDTSARHVNTNPSISQSQAEQIAFNDTLNFGTNPKAVDIELIIARFNSDLCLVWTFGVTNNRGGSWKYLIDAQTGKILFAKSDVIY